MVDVPEVEENFSVINNNQQEAQKKPQVKYKSGTLCSSNIRNASDSSSSASSSNGSSDMEAAGCSPIEIENEFQQQTQQLAINVKQPEISVLNTMIIGDYTATVYPSYHMKWLVQAWGNTTLGSTLESIDNKLITVDKKYIFIALGGNQLCTSTRQSVSMQVLELVSKIRDKNEKSRIYFVGVLPRPIENIEVKPLIVKFNRFLAAAVEKAAVIFERVKFLPAHLEFIQDGAPAEEFFHQDDKLTLNDRGAILLRNTLFRLAGFKKNQ